MIIGGAGFIGSHTADLLLQEGFAVSVFDSLVSQVHRERQERPSYLHRDADFVRGDVRESKLLRKMIQDTDVVLHFASVVGVGQSMYQVKRYTSANVMGTANLLDILVNEEHSVKKVVLASSMSVYGEGKYNCPNCNRVAYPVQRTDEQLKEAKWDHLCEECLSPLLPIATNEETPPRPQSIYALSKLQQEEMALLIGRTYGIPTVALRYFNVYGSRQALSNPYTGACAIFISRILHGKPPYVFEDGTQSRDFVHVKDVARANLKAIESCSATYTAINVGTGRPTSILQLATTLVDMLDPDLKPEVSNTARKGDIRHCYPDVSRAKELLQFEAKVGLLEGLKEVLSWAVSSKRPPADLFDKAYDELKHRKLA